MSSSEKYFKSRRDRRYGVELGIVQKSGSWFSYGSDKLGQGRDTVKQLLHDNPELSAEIENKIREKVKEMNAA